MEQVSHYGEEAGRHADNTPDKDPKSRKANFSFIEEHAFTWGTAIRIDFSANSDDVVQSFWHTELSRADKSMIPRVVAIY